MGHLTQQHINNVTEFLDTQGISFQPLKDELLDHFLLDIEAEMAQGQSFDIAFEHIKKQLVKHQLLTIEQETMEAISKQTTLTTRFTFVALGLLILTTAFKLLHLPGTTLLLFSSISAFTITLLTGALTGITRYKDKLGAGMLLAVIASVVLQIVAWALLVLNLPGATPIRELSIGAIVISFSVATYQFATNERFTNSILSYLHDKNSPGIERVLLIVLGVAALLKISALVMGYPPNVAMVLFVFVIIGGILHFFASQWQYPLTKPMALLLILVFTVGMIPAIGPAIPYTVRASIGSLFYISLAAISLYQSGGTTLQKMTAVILSVFYALLFFNSWNLLGENMHSFLFNPLMLLVLISFLAINWNMRLLKIVFITAIAHFLLEYPVALGFTF